MCQLPEAPIQCSVLEGLLVSQRRPVSVAWAKRMGMSPKVDARHRRSRVLLPMPLTVQQRVKAQRRPLALKPVGLDQTRLAAETQALEQTLDRNVAIVGLSKDAMYATLLEQFCHDGRKRLGRQALALARLRQRDSDLGGRRLVSHDSYCAIPTHRARLPIDDRQLQPLSGLTECDLAL